MIAAIEARLAEVVDQVLDWGQLRVEADAARHHGKRRALLMTSETDVSLARARVGREKVAVEDRDYRRYLTQLFVETAAVELALIAPDGAEVEAARKTVLRELAPGLADEDGHHIRFLGGQVVVPRVLSKLRGEVACVMFLRFKAGIYTSQDSLIIPDVDVQEAAP